jgi:hypothetical protein
MGKWEMRVKFWFETPKKTHYSEDLGADGRVILKCIPRKYSKTLWTELKWSG